MIAIFLQNSKSILSFCFPRFQIKFRKRSENLKDPLGPRIFVDRNKAVKNGGPKGPLLFSLFSQNLIQNLKNPKTN